MPTVASPAYAPPGELVNADLGDGITMAKVYDNRLRAKSEADVGTGATAATSATATVTINGTERSK